MRDTCPVCHAPDAHVRHNPHGRDMVEIDCPRCGAFAISGSADAGLSNLLRVSRPRWAKLSHAIRSTQRNGARPEFTTRGLDAIWTTELPRPPEQADALILHLGTSDVPAGEFVKTSFAELAAILGTEDRDDGKYKGVLFIIGQLVSAKQIESHTETNKNAARLTLDGWQRFRTLETEGIDSQRAFMAMGYGNATSEDAFQRCFHPAVQETGFELLRLDKLPKAGHIDLRMRAEIRTAKFLVVDLTDENRGAYWEAGFAEGLGRPVFYVCEATKFDRVKTHFDTEHLLTIKWTAGDYAGSKDELKAVIRNTFPLDAKMRD